VLLLRLFFGEPRAQQNIDLPTSVVVDPRGSSVALRDTDTEVSAKQPVAPVNVDPYDVSVLIDD
jgi:hypothetical protein